MSEARNFDKVAHLALAHQRGITYDQLRRDYWSLEATGQMIVHKRNPDGMPRNFTLTADRATSGDEQHG